MAEEDYYKRLEVERSASQDEIQKAYYRLARKYHPDVNPNKKTAKQKFQEVQQAFEVLGDPEKRKMYDRYGAAYEQQRQAHAAGGGASGGAGFEGFEELFRRGFGGGAGAEEGAGGNPFDFFAQFRQAQGRPRGGARSRAPRPESQAPHAEITIPFKTAVLGGSKELRVEFHTGEVRTVEVRIPAGIDEGQKIRLRNQAVDDSGGVEDLVVLVHVEPHRWFSRKGKDLSVKVPVTLVEALEGCKIEIPAPRGAVMLSIPPGTSSGTKLRIRGQGIAASGDDGDGDLLAEIAIKIPKSLDAESVAKVKAIFEKHPLAPRVDLEW